MYQSTRSLEKAFAARQSRTLNTVVNYRFFAPAKLAADERLAAALAYHAAVGDAPLAPDRQPGAARRWLGVRLVRLGAWLGGASVPARGATVGG